ncbi:MAG: adenylyltransferase/cytidyltransferase family protein, partial [Gammaproteobacteria bacterium]|nr:adenylyltransferase/cytidyltransferase family protein [Gammaproteobacteria bacterium]
MSSYETGINLRRNRLAAWAEKVHAAGRTIAFTNGCFDIIHRGHLESLKIAAATADELVVAINSDASVTELKGKGRPILPEADRAMLIAALRPVSAVTIFNETTPLECIVQLRPDVLVKGAEYKEVDIVGASEVRSWGGEIVRVSMVEGWSTSNIIEAIKGL